MPSVNVPRAYLDNYTAGVHGIDAMGRQALSQALAATDLGSRTQVTAVMRAHCESATYATAQVAAQFYRGMSILQTGEDVAVEPISGWDGTATDIATNAIITQAGGDPARLLRMLLDREGYEVNRASKYGVWANGNRDSREVRYARVPSGAETCAWCLMTAGLGFWYMTEEAAGHSHRGCDCVIVPGIAFTDVVIDDYDSGLLRDMWRDARQRLMDGDIDPDLMAHILDEAYEKGDEYRMDTNGVLAVLRYYYGLK